MPRYSRVTQNLSKKKQFQRSKRKLLPTKIKLFPPPKKKILSESVIKLLNQIVKKKNLKRSLNTDFPKEMWDPILKGLKHLTTVILANKFRQACDEVATCCP